MPKYVLHYFGARARGEIIRLILNLAGQEFEDHRFSFEEWPAIKPNMPTGQVPVLEIDGKKMNESTSIARYLAREYGFAGKTSLESYYVDRVINTVGDLFNKLADLLFREKDPVKKAELKKDIDEAILPRFMSIFSQYLEEGSDEGVYFVGKSVTLADLAIHDVLTTCLQVDSTILEKYPKLQVNRKVVESHPNLKEYLAKRPITIM